LKHNFDIKAIKSRY